MNKILLLIALASLTFFTKNSFGQAATVELPKILLPSPDAAALGKFGDIPVGYETGVANIGIPLFEIKSPRLSVPINLSYHSGGFRVDEIASSTGLGFSLLAGGSISRTVKSAPDEVQFGILNQGALTLSNVFTRSCDWYTSAVQSCNGTDTESDEYYFSTPHTSGKFVYDELLKPFLIPYKPVDIQFANNSFTLRDSDGTTYLFSDIEQTTSNPYSGCTKNYTSSWNLSKMISVDRSDTIYFEYEAKNQYSIGTWTMSETVGSKITAVNPDGTPTATMDGRDHNDSFILNTYYPKTLKRIRYNNGKVEFNFSEGRSDIDPSLGPKLDRIDIYQKNPGNQYSKLKSFNLAYGYFYSGDGSQTTSEYYRLRLDTLKELNQTNQVIKKHRFEYEANLKLPSRNSYARDLFGFYNGQNSNTSFVRTHNGLVYSNVTYNIGGANRDPNGQFIGGGLLKTIYYPTGGYTRFYFGPHKFQYTDANNITQTVSGGGIRIDSLENYNYDNALIGSERYKYGINETGLGSLLFYSALLTIDYEIKNNRNGCRVGSYTGDSYVFSGGALFDISKFSGSSVLYPKVTRYYGKGTNNNGKSEYEYDVFADELMWYSPTNSNYYTKRTFPPPQVNVPWTQTPMTFILNSNEWKNGNLKREGHFSFVSNQFKLINETINNYTYDLLPPTYRMKVGMKWESCTNCIDWGNPTDNQAAVDYYFYWVSCPIYSGKVMLGQTVTNEYDNMQSLQLSKTTNYQYQNPVHLLPTYIQSNTSTGFSLITRRQYPLDTVLTGNAESARVELNNRHQYDALLVETVKNNETNAIVKQVVNNYKQQANGAPLLDNIQTKVGVNPLETRAQFYSYDKWNNVTEQSLTSNLRKSYVWGYNGAYPIAEVTNGAIGIEVPSNTVAQTTALQNYNQMGVAKSTTLVQIGSFTLGTTETAVETNYGIAHNQQNDSGVPTYLRIVELIFRETTTSTDVIVNLPAPGSGTITTSLTPNKTYNVYYRSQYVEPVDVHINSIVKDRAVPGPSRQIFHTSFEEDLVNISTADFKTGKISHVGSYDILQPQTIGTYILSWWQKDGSNSWQYNEQTITVTTPSTTVTTIGLSTSLIDEVRLYPKNAQMTTFTYSPTIGITSSMDASGVVTYYEYDAFGRLTNVKDNNQKIVKNYQYNYQK
ncbi:MAG: RHS repeat protein [Bacteroidetes bacterium]|nr:RHS repeat protein [Bacteroidota bacterium]